MKYFLLQNQELIDLITKSSNQYPKIKAQTSDELQPSEIYENSTVVFDAMCYQNKPEILICFLQEVVKVFLIFTIYLKADFTCQKKQFVKNLILFFSFKQNLKNIILLFHVIVGLDTN